MKWHARWLEDRLPGALTGVLLALPMVWALGYAVSASLGMTGLGLDGGLTLTYWARALGERGGLPDALILSVLVSGAVTFLAATSALVLVLAARTLLERPWALALLCVPLASPVAVTAFSVYQLISGGGLLARLAYHAGLITGPGEFPVLVNDTLAAGIVIAHLLSATPLLTLFFLALWRAIRIDDYLNLAQTLGASPFRARWQVALPMLLQRGRSLILLLFILTLGSFEIPLLLGKQHPQMFSVLTRRKVAGADLAERPEAFALALLYFALTAGLLLVFLSWRKRRE